MNPSQADFIKKTKVKYLNCKQGGDHQGQVMNFICIDPVCKNKGLICPVCQTTSHLGHQALHLKIFLSEIHKNLLNNDSNQNQLLSVTEQLRNIERSKKQMEKVLREMVLQISQKVKQTEEKINHSYLTLRKIILSQSTISSKLPQLYHLLSGQGENQQFIINQLSKFSQFLEYKNNKIHVIDNAQKLIEQYSKTASSISIHLSTILPEITKKLQNLPFKVKTLGKLDEGKPQANGQYKFSNIQKADFVNLSEDGKTIQMIDQLGGSALVFVEGSEKGSFNKKIALRIKKCKSDSIILGIGTSQKSASKKYIFDQSDNFELSAITSMGFPLNDFDKPSFVFGQGDVIEMQWNIQEVKLTFSRRNGIEKFSLYPPVSSNFDKQQFFVCLGGVGDSVEIVE